MSAAACVAVFRESGLAWRTKRNKVARASRLIADRPGNGEPSCHSTVGCECIASRAAAVQLTSVCATAAALAAITLTTPSASAAYVTVYGGPTYTPGVGGFKGLVRVGGVNNAGVAVGDADKFDGSNMHKGSRAFRWDGSAPPRSSWRTWARTPMATRALSPSPSTTPAPSSAAPRRRLGGGVGRPRRPLGRLRHGSHRTGNLGRR